MSDQAENLRRYFPEPPERNTDDERADDEWCEQVMRALPATPENEPNAKPVTTSICVHVTRGTNTREHWAEYENTRTLADVLAFMREEFGNECEIHLSIVVPPRGM